MASKIVWSSHAVRNLEDICAFIGRDSEKYASIFAQRVITAIEADNPEIGRVVPEYAEISLREKILGNYRIVYQISSETIELVTIIHGSSLLKSKTCS